MLIAYNFPERQYKEIYPVISNILDKEGISHTKADERQWPHISISGDLPSISKEEMENLKENLKDKPKFIINGLKIIPGAKKIFLALTFNIPKEMQDAFDFLKDKYKFIPKFKELFPHISLVEIEPEEKKKVENVLDKIKEAIKKYMYNPIKPNQIQFWDNFQVVHVTEDWAHEVGQVRSELGEIDEIYKDFDHIYNRLFDIEDIISDEQRDRIVKMVEKVRGMVVGAENEFRVITKSPKAPNRKPIKHSTPIGDKKREMQRISTDIGRLSVRIRNIGQSVDDFKDVKTTDIAEHFEKASERLRKVFVQFEKLIPEGFEAMGNLIESIILKEDKTIPVPKEIKSYIDGTDGLPDIDNKNVQKYYQSLQTILPDNDIKLYRGFATAGEIQDGEEIFPDGLVLSFSEDKNTALSFAKDRVEEEPSYYGYVVSVEVPKKRIYFHWKYGGNVGISHPKEKEVLAKLYPDYPFKIEKVIKPIDESMKRKKKKLKMLLAPFYGKGDGKSGATVPPFRAPSANPSPKLGASLPGPSGVNAPQYGTLPAGPTAPMVSDKAIDKENILKENYHLCLVCRGTGKTRTGQPCKICNSEWRSQSVTSVEETMEDGGGNDNSSSFRGFDRSWDL